MSKPLAMLVIATLATGCGRARDTAPLPRELPVSVLADSSFPVTLPPARLPLAGARLTLLAVTPPRGGAAPAPEAPPGEPPPASGAGEALPVDARLRPPVPRATTPFASPGGAVRWVEMDVRVDERGVVTDALPVAGDTAGALVRAAREAARSVRFYPARLSGRPVAVWTRQRFAVPR